MNTETTRPSLSVIECNPEVTYEQYLSPRYRIREKRRWGVHDAQELQPLTLVAVVNVTAPYTMCHLEIPRFPNDFEFEVNQVLACLTNDEFRDVFGKRVLQIESTTSSFGDRDSKLYADQCMSSLKLFEEPSLTFTHRAHLEETLIQVLDRISPVERVFHDQCWSCYATVRVYGPLPPQPHWIHAALQDFTILRHVPDE